MVVLQKKILSCLNIGIVLFLLTGNRLSGQVFTNDAGSREKHFIYEVKQIDEFFERFNNDSASFIRKVYKSYHTRYNVDRTKLIKSLFNQEARNLDPLIVDQFVHDVTAQSRPEKLNFYSDGWYALADCKFRVNGTVIDIPLVLQVVSDARHRSKWMVAAAKSAAHFTDNSPIELHRTTETINFINPESHASTFIALAKAFDDKENLADYFEPAFFERRNGWAFYHALLANQLKFQYVKSITYYFLQTHNWVFTVDYFGRQSLNAGWLINSLKKTSPAEKEQYKQHLLEEK